MSYYEADETKVRDVMKKLMKLCDEADINPSEMCVIGAEVLALTAQLAAEPKGAEDIIEVVNYHIRDAILKKFGSEGSA